MRLSNHDQSLPRFKLTLAATCLLCLMASRAPGIDTSFVYVDDPGFPEIKRAIAPSPKRSRLWLEALDRPETDLQRQAIDAIARAHRMGSPDFKDMAPRLVAVLDAPHAHPIIRLAAIRAIIALDAREMAGKLMKYALQEQGEMALLIEPALARWDHLPMRDVWLGRLERPATSPRMLALAMRALETIGLIEAAPRLRELALDHSLAPDIRLEAARAAGALQPNGLESDVRQLLDGRSSTQLVDSLVAAMLLRRHKEETAVALLCRLAGNSEPAVMAIALQRLLEVDPLAVEPMNAEIVPHPDANVRQLAAKILGQQQTVAAVTLLGEMLDDTHRSVRTAAVESLVKLDGIENLRSHVRERAMESLQSESPRRLEQAAIIVGAVTHKPAAARLVELLNLERHDVHIAAAWALRRLQVPETAGPILAKVKFETEKSLGTVQITGEEGEQTRAAEIIVAYRGKYIQLGHLIEALGVLKHRESIPLLLTYLPSVPLPVDGDFRVDTVWVEHLRVQAIWALGRILEDEPKPEEVASLHDRVLNGDTPMVCAMAAVSLGRMNSLDSLQMLRSLYKPADEYDVLKHGCAWAVKRLTDEPIPEWTVSPARLPDSSWFLKTLEEE